MKTTYKYPIALIILLASLWTGCGGKGTPSDPLAASLSELTGAVEIKDADQQEFSAAEDGMTLQAGGQVRTGEDGRLRLDLSSGSIVRLGPSTNFTLAANEQTDGGLNTNLQLTVGRVWILLTGGSMDVETPSGLASVRGSHLMVWVNPDDGNAWVSCFEGQCGAGNTSGISLDLSTGQGTILASVSTGETPPPPTAYNLSWEEYQLWNASVPEAAALMPEIIPTLTALPTGTATPTATPTLVPTSTFTSTPLPSPTPSQLIVGTWQGVYSPLPEIQVTFRATYTNDGRYQYIADGEPAGSGRYEVTFSGSLGHLDLYDDSGSTIVTLIQMIDSNTMRMENNTPGRSRPTVFSDSFILSRTGQ